MSKFTKFLCLFIVFCLTACSAAIPTQPHPNLLPPTQSNPDASNSVIYGRLTGNEQYPAVFLHESGERLVIIGEPGKDKIRGIVYSSPNTPTMVIYVNEQGLPETGYVGEYILLYTNYTNSTVDVTVISPDGTVNEYPKLEFNKELLGYLGTSAIVSNISFKTSLTSIDKTLLWYLKLGSIVLSVFGCVAAVILSAPLGLVCFGALLKIVPELLKAENPESELIQPLENAGTALDAYQCSNLDAESCADIFLDTAETSTVEANQTYVKQKRVIDEIKLKSSSSPVGGTLSCSDTRLTPEEQVNCGTHSYQKTATKTSYCSIMELNNGNVDVTISFSGSTITMRDSQYTKISTNIYELVEGKTSATSNINKHVYTILFNLNGYEERYAYEGSAGLIDCWLKTYTLMQ